MNISDAFSDRNLFPSRGNGMLGPDIQDIIGKQLRAMYDDLVNQAVPDHFTELLQKLDKRGCEARH